MITIGILICTQNSIDYFLIILLSTHPVAVGVKVFLGAIAGAPMKVVGALSIID